MLCLTPLPYSPPLSAAVLPLLRIVSILKRILPRFEFNLSVFSISFTWLQTISPSHTHTHTQFSHWIFYFYLFVASIFICCRGAKGKCGQRGDSKRPVGAAWGALWFMWPKCQLCISVCLGYTQCTSPLPSPVSLSLSLCSQFWLSSIYGLGLDSGINVGYFCWEKSSELLTTL